MTQAYKSGEEKALEINLDPLWYGSLAEIGAGQEVARYFFRAGGAAGTVAMSVSAYDMKFSDAVYGPSTRYVSRERCQKMLDHELSVLERRLSDERGSCTNFFAFADTVATRSYSRKIDGSGWLGVKFQHKPFARPSQVMIHALLLDPETVLQQEALGILGVNLIYASLRFHEDPARLVASLRDQLALDRVDVNLIDLRGPAFDGVDLRLVNLDLIQNGLTHAVVFDEEGRSVEPGELLYKKPILVQRGTFRPVTLVHDHMLGAARKKFSSTTGTASDEATAIMEITTANLRETSDFEPDDFLSRLDILRVLGRPVLISNYAAFHRLETYLNRYSRKDIGFAVGVLVLRELFEESYYDDLDGGALEAFGRLFKRKVKLYVYPSRDPLTGEVLTAATLTLPPTHVQLYRHLIDNGFIVPIEEYREELFGIQSHAVLESLRSGDASWETQVPDLVAKLIKERALFEYRAEPEVALSS